MNINWKLRLKNKATLTAIISATALFVNQLLTLFGLDYSEQIKQVVDLLATFLTLLAGMGVLIDPTTQGLNDSDYSLEKEEPTSNEVTVYTEPYQPIDSESEVTVDVENN